MLQQILKGLAADARMLVTGRSFIWHAAAIAITFILVVTGFDWWLYENTRSTVLNPLVWAAGIGGFFVPVLVPVGMYIAGEWRKNPLLKERAVAVMEAVILASILAIIYKTFTGRIQPEFMNTIGNTDISKEFQFGFLRHGIFWGWPSSHTAVAVAGGVTLFRLIKNTPVRMLTVLYMIGVAAGAAVGFHWLSDVLAGAIFGTLIGLIVTKRSGSQNTDTIA